MARRDRQHFKASPWELEDAEEEQVDILVNHVPTRFVLREDGSKLVGMEFERPAASGQEPRRSSSPPTTSSSPSGRRTPSPSSSATSASSSASGTCPRSTRRRWRRPGRGLLRRRRGLGTQEHHLGRRARARGGDLHPQPLPGDRAHRAAAGAHEPRHAEDGAHRVELQQRLQPGPPGQDEARRPRGALQAAVDRGRDGLRPRADRARGRALPELRRADGVHRQALHRVRRLRRRLPDQLPDHHRQRRRAGAAPAADRAGDQHHPGDLTCRRACRRPAA